MGFFASLHWAVSLSFLLVSSCQAQINRFTDGDIAGAVVGSILTTLIVCCMVVFAFYWFYIRKREGKVHFEDAISRPGYKVNGASSKPGPQARLTTSVLVPAKNRQSNGSGPIPSTYSNSGFLLPEDDDILDEKMRRSRTKSEGANATRAHPADYEKLQTATSNNQIRHRFSLKHQPSNRERFLTREGEPYYEVQKTTRISTPERPLVLHLDAHLTRVKLRGHDFTGLGFNIAGNLRDGIYVQNVLPKGPAAESGILEPGDRIMEVVVSFKNIVFEDALTILSYASPYDVTLAVRKDADPSRARPSSDQISRRSWQPTTVADKLLEKTFGTLKRSQSNGDLDAISRRGSTSSEEQVFWDPTSEIHKRKPENVGHLIGMRPIPDSPNSSIRHIKLTTLSSSTRHLYDTTLPTSSSESKPESSKEVSEEIVTFSRVGSPKKKPAPPPPPPSKMKRIDMEPELRPYSSVSVSSADTSSSSHPAGSAVEESRSVGASSMLNEIMKEYNREQSLKEITPEKSRKIDEKLREYQTFEMVWTEGSESETSSVLDRHHEHITTDKSRQDPGYHSEHYYARVPSSQVPSETHDDPYPRSPHVIQTTTGSRLILPVNMEPSPPISTPTSFTSDESVSGVRKGQEHEKGSELFVSARKATRY